MRYPIKIIHKYKNSNNFVNYKIFIFLGNYVDNKTKEILEKIKDKSLEDSFKILSKKEFDDLIEAFGKMWYYFFWNKHHIMRSKTQIKKQTDMLSFIKKKFGSKWVDESFISSETILRPVFADKYADFIKNSIKNKNSTSNALIQTGGDDEEVLDNNDDNDNDLENEQEEEDDDDELIFNQQPKNQETELELDEDEINLDEV